MIILQLVLYCALFTLMVRISVIGGAKNALYFYPDEYRKTAFSRGITTEAEVAAKKKRFMIAFYTVMTAALLLIVGLWNRAETFLSAYLQSLLFLEVMNWYDGIVIDRLWVGHSKFWIIKGMEDMPFVQTWQDVLKKRGILTVIWFAGSAISAGIITLVSFCVNR